MGKKSWEEFKRMGKIRRHINIEKDMYVREWFKSVQRWMPKLVLFVLSLSTWFCNFNIGIGCWGEYPTTVIKNKMKGNTIIQEGRFGCPVLGISANSLCTLGLMVFLAPLSFLSQVLSLFFRRYYVALQRQCAEVMWRNQSLVKAHWKFNKTITINWKGAKSF